MCETKNISVVLNKELFFGRRSKNPFYLSNVKVNSTRLHNKFIWRNKYCLRWYGSFQLKCSEPRQTFEEIVKVVSMYKLRSSKLKKWINENYEKY